MLTGIAPRGADLHTYTTSFTFFILALCKKVKPEVLHLEWQKYKDYKVALTYLNILVGLIPLEHMTHSHDVPKTITLMGQILQLQWGVFFSFFCVCEKVNDDLGGQLTAQSYIAACALAVAKPVAVANSTLV